MTKDLALLIGPDQPYLTTEAFLATLDAELHERMSWELASGAVT
jgi:isocitrate dehydrogenase